LTTIQYITNKLFLIDFFSSIGINSRIQEDFRWWIRSLTRNRFLHGRRCQWRCWKSWPSCWRSIL